MRLESALVVSILVLGAEIASADTPKLSPTELYSGLLKSIYDHAGDRLESCSRAAKNRGIAGYAFLLLQTDGNAGFQIEVNGARGLAEVDIACVMQAVSEITQGRNIVVRRKARAPSEFLTSIRVPIGEAVPLPDTSVFLGDLERFARVPDQSAKRRLRSHLPSYAEVEKSRCILFFPGPGVRKTIEKWLEEHAVPIGLPGRETLSRMRGLLFRISRSGDMDLLLGFSDTERPGIQYCHQLCVEWVPGPARHPSAAP